MMRIEELDASNRAAAIALARAAWDRPTADAYFAWRYGSAPTQEAALALVGGSCVATMFALRRTYRAPDGEREALEPYSWHADPAWRARGAGLRVVKHWMAGSRPLLALGGTAAATSLFARLRWARLCTGGTFVLSLHGRHLRARGRGWAFATLFELVVRHHFTPRRATGAVTADVVPEPGPSAMAIARAQRRFAWMRLPDPATWRWLASAPGPLGRYLAFHLRIDGEVVGWATARVHHAGGVLCAELQECFLSDEARAHYPDAIRTLCVRLVGFGVDAIRCVTTCPDTMAALHGLHFRRDIEEQVYAWDGGRPVDAVPALFDGGHADRAFFPVPSGAEWR